MIEDVGLYRVFRINKSETFEKKFVCMFQNADLTKAYENYVMNLTAEEDGEITYAIVEPLKTVHDIVEIKKTGLKPLK